jgi:hypothetical protein
VRGDAAGGRRADQRRDLAALGEAEGDEVGRVVDLETTAPAPAATGMSEAFFEAITAASTYGVQFANRIVGQDREGSQQQALEPAGGESEGKGASQHATTIRLANCTP